MTTPRFKALNTIHALNLLFLLELRANWIFIFLRFGLCKAEGKAHRKKDVSHMLDYCFASKLLIDKVSNVEIGEYDEWKEYSDHYPLIVDFDFS